jgi:putative molybdopterin biosynthesis protein
MLATAEGKLAEIIRTRIVPVAAAVIQGRADWGVAIRSVATLYGLAFLPIAPEQYDFLLREDRRDRPAMQAFLTALRSAELRRRIQAMHMEPERGIERE